MNEMSFYDENGKLLKELHRWDSNITVKIAGVDIADVAEVHICNFFSEKALVLLPAAADDGITVPIPNSLLTTATTIYVYVYGMVGENGRRTTRVLSIPVIDRKQPESYVYTETEVLNYATLDKRMEWFEQNCLTEKDEPRIVADVLAALPAWEGGSY